MRIGQVQRFFDLKSKLLVSAVPAEIGFRGRIVDEPRPNGLLSQLMEYLPSYEFQKCVTRYRGDSYLRGFSCLDIWPWRLRS